MTFEEAIDVLDAFCLEGHQTDAVELACDALAFCQALYTMFKDNGAPLPDDVDLDTLQTVIDGHIGELAAASIFLSNIDKVLDVVTTLESIHESMTDGNNAAYTQHVPYMVRRGYKALAVRIKMLKLQKMAVEVVTDGDPKSGT